MTIAVVRPYLFLFGLLSIAGGTMGFVKAKSAPSLVAGGLAGVLLLVAGYLVGTTHVMAGLVLGLVLSLVLAGRFVPAYLKTKKPMPAGMMAVLSVLAIVLIAVVFFGDGL